MSLPFSRPLSRSHRLPAFGLIAIIATLAVMPGASQAQAQSGVVPGEIVVGMAAAPVSEAPLKAFGSVARQRAVAQEEVAVLRRNVERSVGVVAEDLPKIGAFRVKVRRGLSLSAALNAARRLPGVRYAEPNYYLQAFESTPNDSYFLNSQYGPQKIAAPSAWSIWQPQNTTVVAVVDTGVVLNHPDLANKIYRNSSGGVIGYDFANGDSDPTDDNGHGTHCAGIIGAETNNALGIAGIAGWDGGAGSDVTSTKIMPIKVLSASGSGTMTAVANGITFAADNGAKVISLSLGGGGSTTLANAVSYAWNKGCVLVAAAGNSGSSAQSYPAAYPNVLSVAATDSSDRLASFSNYGSWVSCAAPGVSILSTYPGGYAYLSGTSMACPHVAGEVALLASQVPSLSNSVLRTLVLENTDPVLPYNNRTIAGGRVNVYKALLAASGEATPPAELAAPTNLVARAVSRSQINLTWTDNASDETGYVVERSTNGSSFTVIANLGANATSYASTGLSRRTTYYYRVRAVKSGVSSAYSNTASARTYR
ncbi:MAG: hypothetical protein OHK0029_17450 [Armatimonadaceae bacterium]